MSDRIVYVCGCGGNECGWYALPDPLWRCTRCNQRVTAINIDQLVRERDGLLDGRTQAEGQRNDAEAEVRKSRAECIRLQAENERLMDYLVLAIPCVDNSANLEQRHGSKKRADTFNRLAVKIRAIIASALLASKEQES